MANLTRDEFVSDANISDILRGRYLEVAVCFFSQLTLWINIKYQ